MTDDVAVYSGALERSGGAKERLHQRPNRDWCKDNNKITTIPKSIGKCPNLMEIDLSRNQLEEFPSEGFPKLEWLDITKNKVKELPHATLWPNIKSFWATKNQIKTVPVEFCNPRLDTVNLRNH